MNDNLTRVVVVDDHSMVRSGLRLFLIAFDDMLLVGEAANGLEAVRLCEQVKPDIVLMDLIMPVMDGIRAARELTSRNSHLRVIGLTSFLEADLLQEAIQAGMSGLLSKDISASELVKAIRDVRAGHPAFSEEVTKLLRQPDSAVYSPPEPAAAPTPLAKPMFELTAREREVLALIVNGHSNAEIAQHLVISLSTAKYHVSSILEKLNVANRAEAVSMALQHGLVSPTSLDPQAKLVEAHLPPIDSGK